MKQNLYAGVKLGWGHGGGRQFNWKANAFLRWEGHRPNVFHLAAYLSFQTESECYLIAAISELMS